MENIINNIKTVITHAGIFHADDVACIALLRMVNPEIAVQRVFKAPDTVADDTIVVDIGFGHYDHHQADTELRSDGNKRAACGLVFADLWQELFPTEASAKAFEANFIIPIEDQDNGVIWNPLSLAVKSMNPSWDSDKSSDEAFEEAVAFLQKVFETEVEMAYSEERAKTLVSSAEADTPKQGLIVLDKFVPWQANCSEETVFAVFPSLRGGWNIGVKRGITLPEGWLDNKPTGCTFVHQGLFTAAFDTKENAVAAALSL